MMPDAFARQDRKPVRAAGLMGVVATLMVASPPAVSPAVGQSVQADASTAPAAVRFESASVKRGPKTRPAPSGRLPGFPTPPGRRFSASASTLRELILRAYEIRDFQLTGGPDWQRSDYFDISGSVSRDVTTGELNAMLRTLLAERFGLRTHTETRQAPQYVMTIERSTGTPGARLARTSPVVMRGSTPQESSFGFTGTPLSVLLEMVSYEIAMPVVDRTGLTGLFDVQLIYKPVERPRNPPPPGTPLADKQFRSALQEQLGLKLELVTGPLEVVVIDDVRPPTLD